ncbi:hypothetical protein KSP40_PGU014425 [Platanthera guangdongensis]|uniref:Uncharacterized protein n=1 Tax=Platanthera guangdongensis TaxID=2320717 RepID=A0ABR2LDC8_9ASPA
MSLEPGRRKASKSPAGGRRNCDNVPTAFSEANSLAGAAVDRRSKLEDRRSSRTVLQEKKRRSRVEDLETKLGETMVELKVLKEQLELEEVATRVVLKKLENTKKKEERKKLLPVEKDCDSCITTDICEVAACCAEENESLMMEMAEMRAKLAEKEKELEIVKKEAEQATASSSAQRNKNNEMETKLAETEEELRQSREMLEQMKQKLESQEIEKDAMEAEMKRLRIQTDQWRKASEAAASILNHESFRSVGKPIDTCGEGRGGGRGIWALGELWKKRGQQK